MPVATDHDLEYIRRLKSLFNRARNQRKDYHERWDRNYRLLNNRIGGRTTLSAASWPPSPRDSEIFPLLSSIVAWMADQHTIVDCSPATDPGSPLFTTLSKLAQDLGTTLESNWSVLDYGSQTKLAIWDALLYNAGWVKTVWDQGLDGGLGNTKFVRIDPYSFYIDPDARNLDEAEYMIEARLMSLAEIERRWPGKSVLVEGSMASSSDIDTAPNMGQDLNRQPKTNPGNFSTISGTYGASSSGTSGTRWGGVTSGPTSELNRRVAVYEYWLRENDEYYDENEDSPTYNEKQVKDRWRVVILCADQILMDEYAEDLYSFPGHPYDRYLFDDIGELYGISLVDHLAYPQIYINRLLSALQSNLELSGNPIWVESSNSGLGRTGITARPGLRLQVNNMQNNMPQWAQPPSMPQGVQELIKFWIERMEAAAGLSAASKGQISGTRTSDQVMSTIQEAAFVRIRNAIDNLEHTLTSVGYKLASLIADNYNTERFISIIGEDGEKTALALKAHHFEWPSDDHKVPPFKYTLNINAGSAMPTSRQARAAQADKAYGLGLYDRQAWYESNQIPNWQAIEKRIKEAIAAGIWNPPGQRQRSSKSGTRQ